MLEAKRALNRYFEFYNYERQHQGLSYKKPAEVHFGICYKNADADRVKSELLSGLKRNYESCFKSVKNEITLQ
ncbi:hypothetical protein [Facilibium subflavum]|uniref:hypothetical protein n=1 Tax=Facilibium subflavum TaxID=2219058 RepID=UPI000E65280A|nr:hypothetical protein [Facilibium subflavum]